MGPGSSGGPELVLNGIRESALVFIVDRHTEAELAQDNDTLRALRHLAHLLPSQPPIKNFIHHNTLHAFQDRPFDLGVEEAGMFYGARTYETFEFYRERYQCGLITEAALDNVLADRIAVEAERTQWKHCLLNENWEEPALPRGISSGGMRDHWRQARGLDLDALVHPLLFRLLSNFLDQGVAIWEMPDSELGFFGAVRALVKSSFLPLIPLSDARLAPLWESDEDLVIQLCLQRIVQHPEDNERYLAEMLFRHPGWSGMVVQVEQNPSSLLARKSITLKQAVAVELMIELGWLYRELGDDFAPAVSVRRGGAIPERLSQLSTGQLAKVLWHNAFEETLYQGFFAALRANVQRGGGESVELPKVQSVFCIDDREGGLRRHLEEVWPKVETFAVAGFFGIDIMYQGIDDSYPAQHCPVGWRPKHLLRSRAVSGAKKAPRRARHFLLDKGANTLMRGWMITQVLGFWSALRLAVQVFFPTPSWAMASSLSKVELDSELHLLRESDVPTADGLLLGFSHAEMADRVANVLKQMGCTSRFADLFIMTAHGASSTNNPHFAAYDCGACSGQPGAPNARAFALMANDPAVRALLPERGVHLPATTHVLGSLHDTTRDEIVYFDEEKVPARLRPLLEEYKLKVNLALERNARERCRRFLLVPQGVSLKGAQEEVRQRSAAIFEPRPELNHATNAMTLIGRRKWTRGMFLDRRAFMNSYDPESDPQGNILTNILGAAVPVCGGINLEYFFSRVDNEVYGAGTKLPHNVFGLIGVANGVSGDLRTGLPRQMVEAHDPVRLLFLVEQTPEVALEAAQRNPAVWEWIEKAWVFYSCLDPKSGRLYRYRAGAMRPVVSPELPVTEVRDSLELASRGEENLPFTLIDTELAGS